MHQIFGRKALSDERINRFFDDVDMERQAAEQKAFLTMVAVGDLLETVKADPDLKRAGLFLAGAKLADIRADAFAAAA